MAMGAVVGEMLASAVVKEVVRKLGAFVGAEIGLLWKFKDDLESMRSTLETLQAVLMDAEKRSSREERVRLWLKTLKSAAYDIEDMLVEFETKNTAKEETRDRDDSVLRKVTQFCPNLSRITIAPKIKKMKERLQKIKEEAKLDVFNFKSDTSSSEEEVNSRATFSAISEDIVGRAAEKEAIISMLTAYSEEEISTISIYGFGGLGKTILARLAFNEENVERVFDRRVWVYVSMKFDLKKIGESILSEIEEGSHSHITLQDVSRHLERVLAGKKFLIVLDDLWEENGSQLEKLKAMLRGGVKGSKIIVTTRSEKVAMLMSPCQSYKLDVLSDDDCWILFKRRAFVLGTEDPRLVEIGRDIVKKCKGVPLSAQTLGFVMRFKEGVAAWTAMRDSEIWEMEEDQNILPSLKLSYYNMPSHLRLCFAYCAVYSKGCVIDKYVLIQQWIALGLIQPACGNLILEKRAEEYVKELVGMSFLQVSTTSSLVTSKHMKAPRVFQMHDLVYDLARCVAGEEFLFLDAKKSGSANAGSSDYRYAVLLNYSEMLTIHKNVLHKARALHLKDCKELQFPRKASSLSKFLRVLDLSGCSILELPSEINQMKQLQYLDASGMQSRGQHEYFSSLQSLRALNLSVSSIEALPVQIGTLDKLHYLNLHGCSHLIMIPESFGELRDLLHLDLSGCISLQVLPASFGKLHKLSFLDLSGCLNLHTLPESFGNLCHLEDLNLSSCQKLGGLPEPFGNLQQLLILDMSGCQKLHILPRSLCHLLHLEDLNLSCCYELQELPKDFGSLQRLRILDLADCHKLRMLPESFTDLMNLENLILSDCWELRELPVSFGDLRKLQFLDISCCSQLCALPESLCSLINLEHLNMSCCVTLEEVPGYYGNLKNLETLNISYCSNILIPHGIADMCSLKTLLAVGLDLYSGQNQKDISCVTNSTMYMPKICFAGKIEPCSDSDESMKHTNLELRGLSSVQNLEEVEKFELRRRQQLHSLRLNGYGLQVETIENTVSYDVVLEKLLPPRTLEHLELQGYKGVKYPSWVLRMTSFLPNLVHLEISGLERCDHLPPLGQLPKLQSLVIRDIPNIRKVGKDFAGGSRSFLKLRDLNIGDMLNLEEWPTTLSANDVDEFMFPNLHHLKVVRCVKLRFDPSLPQCLSLEIDTCDELLLEQPNTPSYPMTTTRISIQSCMLSSVGWKGLQCFTALKFLSMCFCKLSTWRESIGALTSLEKLELSLSDVPECLGDLTPLRSMEITMCSLPCDFPRQLLQLISLEKLLISGCSIEFEELTGEEAKAILAQIPNVYIYSVEHIRCVEQKNGILSTCQIGPTCQGSSDSLDDGRKVVRAGPCKLKRGLRVKRHETGRLKLRRHKCRMTFVPRHVREGNEAATASQEAEEILSLGRFTRQRCIKLRGKTLTFFLT